MVAKQQRVGGGMTNTMQAQQQQLTSPSPRPSPRPSPHAMGADAPPSRPASSNRRPHTSRSEGERGGSRAGTGTPRVMTASSRGSGSGGAFPAAPGMYGGGVPGSRGSTARSRKDELFGTGGGLQGASPKPPRSRPASAPSRSSSRAEERAETARSGASSSRGSTEVFDEVVADHDRERELRPTTASSEASSVVEGKLVQFQKSFRDKNSTKFHNLQEAFRNSDTNKNGVLGAEEIAHAMRALDIPVDKPVIHRLLARAEGKDGLSFQEFRDQLWIDDRMTTVVDERKNARAGSKGDNAGQKYLWTPLKNPSHFVGTLNDTLEVDTIEAGTIRHRLDGNFSSVQYDILALDENRRGIHPSVRIPVKQRVALFDPPPPLGRRVAYDRGDCPYDVVNLNDGLPGMQRSEASMRSSRFQAPVRLVTFARVHNGEYPTQQAHMLTKTFV
uniref:EF-hand domain-containing protein n=1 Tax=Hemiselmis andersenii TaxID=464988 RepID=A0A7S1DH40_HEMAN|mmetsp:Transcript_13178/g.32339  ORF Transcript_13178/g.32339 Transcript_13178/m.32339 type:complete len:445 (+) Transcript_13178:264-1598(+)